MIPVILSLAAGLGAGVLLAQIYAGLWLVVYDGAGWRAARARLVRGELRSSIGSWPVAAAVRVSGGLYVVVVGQLLWVEEQQLARARRSLVLSELFRSRRVDLTQIAAMAALSIAVYLLLRSFEHAGQLAQISRDIAVVRDVLSKPLVVAP